ncbi:MAG: hypothetical protein AAF961_13540 [Planctomycetota bacterium]
MLRLRFNLLALWTLILIDCVTASALGVQRWSVHVVEEHAVLRVTPNTDAKLVASAILGLQESGVAKFSLRSNESGDPNGMKVPWYSIEVVDGKAKLTATRDLPHQFVKAAIDKLKVQGITQVKINLANKAESNAPPR